MPIKYKKITVDDAEIFRKFLLTVSSETDFLLSTTAENDVGIEKIRNQIDFVNKHHSYNLIIAELEGLIVGYIYAFPVQGFKKMHSCQIVVAVLKSHWRMGISKSLLQSIIFWHREAGYKRLELSVASTNAAAIGLYNLFGFEVEGIKKKSFLFNSDYVDEILMAKIVN